MDYIFKLLLFVFGYQASTDARSRSKCDLKENLSPPDRLVASYAVAAHAAALASHHPISKAAEHYLNNNRLNRSLGSNGRLKHLKKSKNQVLNLSTNNYSEIDTNKELNNVENSGILTNFVTKDHTWTRIVDRKARIVTYAS